MPEVTRERTVQASPDEVWRLVSDPFHLPRWWPATARVEDASDDAWTSVLTTPAGKTVRADFTRVEAEPPRRLSWRQELEESPFERVFSSAVTAIELEPAGEGATRVALTAIEKLRGRYRLGGWIVRRAARRRLDDALAGLERAVAPEPSE
jgi:uncharacterized protein YndB with AHSA1/START domain